MSHAEEMSPEQLNLNGEKVGNAYLVTISRKVTETGNDEEAAEVKTMEGRTKKYKIRASGHGEAIDKAMAKHGDVGDGYKVTITSECKS